MKRTYYIVEHVDGNKQKFWSAHKRGILSTLNIFSHSNYIKGTKTYSNSDQCRQKLLGMSITGKPKLIQNLKV